MVKTNVMYFNDLDDFRAIENSEPSQLIVINRFAKCNSFRSSSQKPDDALQVPVHKNSQHGRVLIGPGRCHYALMKQSIYLKQ